MAGILNCSTSRRAWTAADIPDLTGKVAIVTGANSGIGFAAAKEFARKGANIILACRDPSKAQAALFQIQAEIPDSRAEVMLLDLASLASVRQFAHEFRKKFNQLDILVNNAGIMMIPYDTTEDGHEKQMATNHLGHFALTGLLLDLIINTHGSRVVTVSSWGHIYGRMDFDNLMFEEGQGYSPGEAYGRSKLANILFAYELQRRVRAAGYDTKSSAVHPGWTDTNLSKHHVPFVRLFNPIIAQKPVMGALPTLYAATADVVEGGDYYGPGQLFGIRGYPKRVESSKASHSVSDAQQLWQVSVALTGVAFEALG